MNSNSTFLHLSSTLALLLMFSGLSNAQVADTSYFLKGRDDLNLLEAVINTDSMAVDLLLSRGANPGSVSTGNYSALMYAAEIGHLGIMKLLVGYGADVNYSGYKGETALMLTIFNNDFQSAKYLLEQGADPNIKDDYGVTPLVYAAAANQYQSADLLLFYQANPELSDSNGNDPLIAAVTFENLETSDVLLQNGLDVNTRDNKGNTPLIIATQRANYDILDLLLDYNADVNLANDKNYTPLAYAVTYSDLKATKMLLAKDADVHHIVDKGRNIADLARISANDSINHLIADKGAKPTKGVDFSEFNFSFGNSFNGSDYFLQFRGGLVDTKQGYFFQTGIDFRPVLSKIQTTVNDTIYLLRERRIGWSHSAGKYFYLLKSTEGLNLALYGALTGYLSFPQYRGYGELAGVNYTMIPSAGIAVITKFSGIKFGVDWYNFTSELDKSLKYNISLIFRLSYPEVHYDRKEIYWE